MTFAEARKHFPASLLVTIQDATTEILETHEEHGIDEINDDGIFVAVYKLEAIRRACVKRTLEPVK